MASSQNNNSKKNGKNRKALVRAHMQATGLSYQAANASLARMGNHPTVEEVVEWFFGNYEDPAENVPYEGGYVYYNRGPYDAEEEIENHFGALPKYVVDGALDVIHQRGWDWVKNNQYP